LSVLLLAIVLSVLLLLAIVLSVLLLAIVLSVLLLAIVLSVLLLAIVLSKQWPKEEHDQNYNCCVLKHSHLFCCPSLIFGFPFYYSNTLMIRIITVVF
jgi:hypothetical protein